MITSLELRNFKKFKQSKKLEFSKGINIIRGNNEAGKSSIMSAILTTFFQDVTTKSKKFFETASNWQTDSKDIYLEANFLTKNGSYQLVRDFKNQKQFIENSSKKQKTDDPTQILKILKQELKIPPENIFQSTSFIRQAEITNIQFSGDLKTSLQRVGSLTPEGTNLEQNIKILEKELKQIELGLNRPSKNPGILKSATDELKKLQTELTTKQAQWQKVQQAKTSGDKSSSKLTEIEGKSKELNELLENHKKLEEINKRLKLLDGQIKEVTETLSQVTDQSRQIKQIKTEISTLGNFSNKEEIEADSQKLTEIRQFIRIQQETGTELTDKLTKVAKPQKLNYLGFTKKQFKNNFLTFGGLLAMAFAISGILVGILLESSTLTMIGLGLSGVGITAIGIGMTLKYISSSQKTESKQSKLSPEAQEIQDQIDSINEKITKAQAEQQKIIGKYGVGDMSQFITKKARLVTLQEELARIEAKIEGQLSGKPLEEVQKQQTDLLTQKKEIEVNELTDEVKAAELSPNDYLRKRRELDMLLIEKKRLERDTTVSEVRTQEAPVTHEEIVYLEEQIEITSENLTKIKHRRQVLTQTIQLLKKAITKTSKSASNFLSQEVESYLPKLTLDRYKDMRLTQNYSIEVFSSELNDWVEPVGKVSLGTVDQIYFLCRIALTKTLLGGTINYLFLDDPFVTFDEQRLAQMREILTELGKSSQIFLFTHNEFYKDWGNYIYLN